MPYTLLTAVPFPHLSEGMAYLTIQVCENVSFVDREVFNIQGELAVD